MINSKELTFGRNETFFLRYGWIAKGLSAYQQDPKIFNEVDAPLKLGVGKNMVSSIKYWLKAYDIISADGEITEFGMRIFDLTTGLDPYSEDEMTIGFCIGNFAKIQMKEHCIFGFSIFSKRPTSPLAIGERSRRMVGKIRHSISQYPQKRSCPPFKDLLGKSSEEISPEDFLDNPFSNLSLINLSRDERTYSCPVKMRSGISPELIGFCLADLQLQENLTRVPLDFFIDEKEKISLTGIFKIDRDNLTILIEELAIKVPEFLSLEDGIEGKSIIFQKSFDPFYFLELK